MAGIQVTDSDLDGNDASEYLTMHRPIPYRIDVDGEYDSTTVTIQTAAPSSSTFKDAKDANGVIQFTADDSTVLQGPGRVRLKAPSAGGSFDVLFRIEPTDPC